MSAGYREVLLPLFYSHCPGCCQSPALRVSGSLATRCDNSWCLMNPWATLGTVNGCWAWFPWQDLVAVGTLEHFCHAPAVTGPAWMASMGTSRIHLHLYAYFPGAAECTEEPSGNSLIPVFFLQKSEFIHSYKCWVCGSGVMAHRHRNVWLELAPGPTAVRPQFCVPGLRGPCPTSWAQLCYEQKSGHGGSWLGGEGGAWYQE